MLVTTLLAFPFNWNDVAPSKFNAETLNTKRYLLLVSGKKALYRMPSLSYRVAPVIVIAPPEVEELAFPTSLHPVQLASV